MMARESKCSVADCWGEEGLGEGFQRALTTQEYNRWLDLKTSLTDVSPSPEPNYGFLDYKQEQTVYLPQNPFTVSFLVVGFRAGCLMSGFIWKSRLPLKIKFFL